MKTQTQPNTNHSKSYILKVIVKDVNNHEIPLIAERNDTWVDSLIGTPPIIKWFEFSLDNEVNIKWLLKDNYIDILEEIDLSNKNHKDQKILNGRKRFWCERYNIYSEENRQCNVGIENILRKKKQEMVRIKQELEDKFMGLIIQDKVFSLLLDFIIYPHETVLKDIKNKTRWELYEKVNNGEQIFYSPDHFVVYMILKDEFRNILEIFYKDLKKYCYGWWVNNKSFWSTLCIGDSINPHFLRFFSQWYTFKTPKTKKFNWSSLILRPEKHNHQLKLLLKEIKKYNNGNSIFNEDHDWFWDLQDLYDVLLKK